jgi:hypothetical protein
METIADVKVWISKYQSYIGALKQYAIDFPDTQLAKDLIAQIGALDPNVDLSTIPFDQLITQFKDVYTSFIDWYHSYFGPEGAFQISAS